MGLQSGQTPPQRVWVCISALHLFLHAYTRLEPVLLECKALEQECWSSPVLWPEVRGKGDGGGEGYVVGDSCVGLAL